MSYSYDAGISTPGYAGLIECGGVRINSSDITNSEPAGGTFKLTNNPFFGTPPVRLVASPLPSDSGSTLSVAYFDAWPGSVEGWLWVPSGPDDVAGAEDQLKAAFSMVNGLQTLVMKKRGWAQRRQLSVQLNGEITFSPRGSRLLVPTRNFVIPVIAPDPFAYNADSQHSVDLAYGGPSVQLPNAGNAPATFAVTFSGPATNPALIDNVTGQSIELTVTVGGAAVTVQTNPVIGITAVNASGTNNYHYVSAFTLVTIPPGTSRTFHATATGVSGGAKATVVYRDAWA